MTRRINTAPLTVKPKRFTDQAPPILLPVSRDDIPTLARVEISALSSNLLFRLYFPDPENFYTHLVTSLEECFHNPELTMWFVKALNEDGAIMGWGAWSVRPCDLALRGPASKVWPSWMFVDPGKLSGSQQDEGVSGFTTAGDLPTYVHDRTRMVLDDWMLGRCHLLLNGLFTLPKYQKRGVGAAILEWGNARADAQGLLSFVQSTLGACDLYKKEGWKDVGNLKLDLTRWAEGGNGLGWGEYQIRYLVRLSTDRKEKERQGLVSKLKVAGIGKRSSDMLRGIDYL